MPKILKVFGDTLGPLGFPCSDSEAKELESKLETGEYSYFKFQKALPSEGFFPGERAEISIINDDSVDKEFDVIDPDTLDFKAFEAHGSPVAFNHNYEIPPVGRSMWFKKIGNCWKAKTTYPERPNDYPKEQPWFPSTIWHLIQNGLLRGKSIGGLVKYRQPTEKDFEKNPNWKAAKRISTIAKVWEYSVCPIAVNTNAIVESVAKSLIQFPSSMLEVYFPEVYTELQKAQKEMPFITQFRTKDDYIKEKKLALDNYLENLNKALPQLIEDQLKRTLGKVC